MVPKLILLEYAAQKLNLSEVILYNEFKKKIIKGQIISNPQSNIKNSIFLDYRNLIEFCELNNINYENLNI